MLDPTLRYLCVRCGRTTVISAAEFARLPEMSPQEIVAPSCDITPSPEDLQSLQPPAEEPKPKP